MARTLSILSATVLLLTASAAQGVLDDGSFELATPNTQTSNSAWSLSVNFPDTIDPAAQFQDAFWASDPDGTGVWFRAFEGNQEIGDPAAEAELTQTVLGVSGGDYALTFHAKREANFTASDWSVSLTSSGTGGSISIDLLAAAPNDANWHIYEILLSGVSAGDDLTVGAEMLGGVDALLNPQSAFLDSFVLAPEPSGGTLMLGAAAMLALRRRGRRGSIRASVPDGGRNFGSTGKPYRRGI